jgi:hypothetical protein
MILNFIPESLQPETREKRKPRLRSVSATSKTRAQLEPATKAKRQPATFSAYNLVSSIFQPTVHISATN